MTHSLKTYIIIFLLSLFPVFVAGQIPGNDKNQNTAGKKGFGNSEIAAGQKEYLEKMYYKTFVTSNDFIDGKEYFNYAYKSKNSPLLSSAKEFNAILFLDGRRYDNIKLQYDSYIDEVLYTDTSRVINYQFPKVVLKKNAVDGFILMSGIDSMKFGNFKFLNDNVNNTDGGYYEIVYNGPSRYLIKHRALLYLSEARNEYKYSPENFILKDGIYTKVRNNKEFLNLFGNRSKEIKSFMRRNRFNVRRANKQEIVMALKYCDELVKKQ
jgi:hypothetical protein